MFSRISYTLQTISEKMHIPSFHWTDAVEVVIIAFLVYRILLWIKESRAWSFLKGLIVILVFVGIASICRMNTILWIVQNAFGILATALIVILQPELRAALENLGRRKWFASFFSFDRSLDAEEGRFSDRTVNEIVRACVEMGKAKTGALIVIEMEDPLGEYIRTGIDVDGVLTSQLLINIFEHNTPLHDGAVIVRGNRIVAATCYLPLSDNMQLSKELGTRHRAGVGVSEVTDSLTLIVSEETGQISVAYHGGLERGLGSERLKTRLIDIQDKPSEEKKQHKLWKGRSEHEE